MLQGSLPGQIVYGHPALRSRDFEDGTFPPKKRAWGGGGEGRQEGEGKKLLYSFIAINLYSNFMLVLHFASHIFFSCLPALLSWQVLLLKSFGLAPQLV